MFHVSSIGLKRPERGRVGSYTAPALVYCREQAISLKTPEVLSDLSSTPRIESCCSELRDNSWIIIGRVFFRFSSHLSVCCCEFLARSLTPTLARMNARTSVANARAHASRW